MEKVSESCRILVNVLFLILMLLIGAAVLVWDLNYEIPFPNQCRMENVFYFVLAGVVLGAMLLLERRRSRDLCEWLYHWILGISGIFGGGLQLLISKRANLPSGDFAEVMQAAISLSQGGSFAKNAYFIRCPNNANLAIFLSWVYRMLGDWRRMVFLGALLTTGSAILVSLAVRNFTKHRLTALWVFLAAEVLQALTWRAFLVYTDNFGMIFVAGVLFLLSTDLTYRWKVPLLCLTAALGSFIKVTVAIPMASIVLCFLLKSGFQKPDLAEGRKILYGVVCLIFSFSVLLIGQGCLQKHYRLETTEKLYVTDWQYMFMLGQNSDSYGTYNDLDAGEIFYRVNREAEEKGLDRGYVNEQFLQEALQRIQSRGWMGNLSFYLGKLDVAYCDGYFNNVQAGLDGELKEPKMDFLYAVLDPAGALYSAGVVGLQVVWDSVLILLFLGAILSLREKGVENCLKLMILGITLYLMIFENRSKYLYMFLPVYLCLAGMGLYRMRKFLSRKAIHIF